MKKILLAIVAISLLCGCFAGFAACGNKQKEGVISIRNLYFENWSAEQGDSCIEFIQEKFDVKFETSTYSFENWSNQVNSDVMGGNLPDVFQANVTSYNFANYYTYWADGQVIKPLPDDLTPWPNLKKMIDGVKDIEYLKYNGKLYGIPIVRNINTSEEVPFAPFTYMYRRDIAKKLGVYQEDDIYTWEQFRALLAKFKTEFAASTGYALGDAEWGYPSLMNFYKTAPHCFTEKDGVIVNNYYTTEYQTGLETVKKFVEDKWYYQGQLQVSNQQNQVKKQYTQKKLGIFYENLSLSNYQQIRDEFTKNGVADKDLNDYTAIMKVKGPDGKFALEGQEDWFSMTFMNYDISDSKMEKVLDIMDWLLSEEGTMMALYGIAGSDYIIEVPGQEPTLLDSNLWEKNSKGEYIDSPNGARYLRYMVTLGHDIIGRDPLVLHSENKKAAYDILRDWDNFMMTQNSAGALKVLTEPAAVKWMQTPKKLENAGKLLDNANTKVLMYTFSRESKSDYAAAMTNDQWKSVLKEINDNLNK